MLHKIDPQLLEKGFSPPLGSYIEGNLISLNAHPLPADGIFGFQLKHPPTALSHTSHNIDVFIRPPSSSTIPAAAQDNLERAAALMKGHFGKPVRVDLGGGKGEGEGMEVRLREAQGLNNVKVKGRFVNGTCVHLMKTDGSHEVVDCMITTSPTWFLSQNSTAPPTPPQPATNLKRKPSDPPSDPPPHKTAKPNPLPNNEIPAKGANTVKNVFAAHAPLLPVTSVLGEPVVGRKKMVGLLQHPVPKPVRVVQEEVLSPIQSTAPSGRWGAGKENVERAGDEEREAKGGRKVLSANSDGSTQNSQKSGEGDVGGGVDKGKGRDMAPPKEPSNPERSNPTQEDPDIDMDAPHPSAFPSSYHPTPTPTPAPYPAAQPPRAPEPSCPAGPSDHARRAEKAIAERTKKQKKREKKELQQLQARQAKLAAVERAVSEAGRRVVERYKKDNGLVVKYKFGAGERSLEYRSLEGWGANDKDASDTRYKASGTANVIVAVRGVDVHPPYGNGDHRVVVQVQDATRFEDDDFTIVSLFSKRPLGFPTPVPAGSVLLLRDLWYDRSNSGRFTMKGMSSKPWSWALLSRPLEGDIPNPVFTLGETTQCPKYPCPLSDAEKIRMQTVMDWYTLEVKPTVQAEVLLGPDGLKEVVGRPKGRPTVTLEGMKYGVFCDITVQVLGISYWNNDAKLEIAVADYTKSSELHTSETYGFEGLEEGMVSSFTLWDGMAVTGAEELKPGTIVHFTNVEVKNGGMGLEGVLRGSDPRRGIGKGGRYKVLGENEMPARELMQRQALSIKRLATGDSYRRKSSGMTNDLEAREKRALEAVVSAQLETKHDGQKFSTIEEVLGNRTVPNRFRMKGRVLEIRSMHRQKPYVGWCKTCDVSISSQHCSVCNDITNRQAEYRWRVFATVADDEDSETTIPVQIWQPYLPLVLPKLPLFPSDAAQQEAQKSELSESVKQLATLLYGSKVNEHYARPQIDWTIESFLACAPDGTQHRMFRAFDMI